MVNEHTCQISPPLLAILELHVLHSNMFKQVTIISKPRVANGAKVFFDVEVFYLNMCIDTTSAPEFLVTKFTFNNSFLLNRHVIMSVQMLDELVFVEIAADAKI